MSWLLLVFLAASTAVGVFLLTLDCCRYARVASPNIRFVSFGDLLQIKSFLLAMFMVSAFGIFLILGLWAVPFWAVLSFYFVRHLPQILDKRRAEKLRRVCEGELDALADIVAMGVRAGLSFDAALELYCSRFKTELANQVGTACLRWQSGISSREQSLGELAEHLSSKVFRRFAETSTQAIRYGSPLADMLTGFAREVRRERREQMERRIAKAPVKMLVPTAVFILPAMLILVMGPVLMQFFDAGF